MKKFFFLLIACFFALCGEGGWAQNLPFPYDVHVETVAGNCYDDSRAIITLWDAFNNEIQINPNTHNASNIANYPLYNVQYYYRNLSAGSNTRYDTLNNIQLSAGTYCFGVIGYVPVTTGGVTTYEQVDTTLCNIVVPTLYTHLEASVLVGIAADNNGDREYCGIHCAFECGDVGRIQLKLRYGNFPYRVEIYDENNQLVRDRYFYHRQHNGTDSIYADFRDFYTFDSLPAGDYSVVASDSCGYSIRLSVGVPLSSINYISESVVNSSNCTDTSIVGIQRYVGWNNSTHNYDIPYLENLLLYRYINPGRDTTQWMPFSSTELLNNYSYGYDSLSSISRYCDLIGDTIIFQVLDQCRDTFYTSQIIFGSRIGMQRYGYGDTPEILVPFSLEYDTCVVHSYSGLGTQRYIIGGYYAPNYGGAYLYEPGTYTYHLSPFIYTCPLSLDIYTEHDEQQLAHDEKDNFTQLVCSFTNPTNTDTSMIVHVVLSDAQGCILDELYLPYEFTIETPGDAPYEWEFEQNDQSCASQWYLSLKEKDVNFYRFRHNVTVQLVESPLYNHYNFTATYNDTDETWDVVMEDTANHSTNVTFAMGIGWSCTVSDPHLHTGRYCFVCTTECGIDTFTYVYSYSQNRDWLTVFDEEPQFTGVQICDRYFVTPYSVCTNYRYRIDVNVSNDELIETPVSITPYYSVLSGPVSGWYYSNGQMVFTIPGDYVIETRASGSCSSTLYHYDTVTYEPVYIDFDMGFAVICNAQSSTGNVLTHAINGTQPYLYSLYANADLEGELLGTSTDGFFYDIPFTEGQQVSVLAVDACQNSFYINLAVTTLSQSTLAWENGPAPGEGHCEGDSALLAALPFSVSVNYHWTGPNGFESNERDNTIQLSYGSESGWYVVEVTNTGCPNDFSDSVYIEVFHAPTIEIVGDTTLCAGSEVELALAAQGNGVVHYTLHHSGAPQSGTLSLTTQAGDTLRQTFPIWGDNIFWVTGVEDERCAYHHTIDTTLVQVYGIESVETADILPLDGFACYGYEAVLQAGSALSAPFVVNWYNSPLQDTLLQQDTIWDNEQLAAFSLPNLQQDTVLYVTISNASHCASLYGAIHHSLSMGNGTVALQNGEGVRFFDSGGEDGDYSNDEQLTQTFCCSGQGGLRLLFNSLVVAAGDTLFIYAGTSADDANLLIAITNSAFPPEIATNSSCITFRFSSNWVHTGSGWNIDILTDVVMTEVHGYIIPPYQDTVEVEVCESEIPYTLGLFCNLDISTPGHFIFDSLFIADNGCDSLVHLELTVHPIRYTELDSTVCASRLPLLWNGLSFSGDGTQNMYLQSSHGCDSIVTMTVNSIDDHLQITMLTEDPCADFAADLLAQTEMTVFQWSTGETTPQITVLHPGTYYVTASDGNCIATDKFFVPECEFYIYLPNAITPTRDDGINDCFFVPQHSQRQIIDFEIIIYNRWGQIVFRSKDKNFKWNGSSNGKIMANSTYTYTINCTNYNGKKFHFKGIITVL